MEMPMPPAGGPPDMAGPGAGGPPGGGAPDIHGMLVEMLGQARRLADDNGLDFDALVQEAAASGGAEGGPMPPPPPPMGRMGPQSGAMGPGPSMPPM